MQKENKKKKFIQKLFRKSKGSIPLLEEKKDIKKLIRKIEKGLRNREFLELDEKQRDEVISLVCQIHRKKLKINPKGDREANELLLKAGQNGNISLLLKALMKGASIYGIWGNDGKTFFHTAVSNLNLKIIKFIFENKEMFEIFKPLFYFFDYHKRTMLTLSLEISSIEKDARKITDYLVKIGFNPLIGKVLSIGEVRLHTYYKQKWLNALQNSTTIEELKENLKKEEINPKEELLELSLKHPDMLSVLAEDCDSLLLSVLKS